MDTSFLIANSQGYYWTLEPLNLLKQPDSRVVIPRGVEHEYRKLMSDSTRVQIPGGTFKDIFELLDIREFGIYVGNLREALAEKLAQEVEYLQHKHKPLSLTDKTLVQAAYDFAREGEAVAVVSSDKGILDKVESLNYKDKLWIDRYSPWKSPSRQNGLAVLVSDESFQQIEAMPPSDANKKYLVVAKNLHIGGGVNYDIAFAVYVNNNNALIFPRIGDVYFIRLLEIPLPKNRNNLNLLAMDMIAWYFRDTHNIRLTKNPNHLTPLELGSIQARRKARRETQRDLDRVDSASSQLEVATWARISKDDIKRHDSLTVGKLDSIVRMLDKQIH